MRKVKMDIKE